MSDEEDDRSIGEKIEEDLNNAIAAALSKYETNFVTKWVTLLEAVDEDGERAIWTFTSPGAKRWDIQGMIDEANGYQDAHRFIEVMEAHGFGD